MNIEAIRVKGTLKCGGNIYRKGVVFNSEENPIPTDLVMELRLNTGMVEEIKIPPKHPSVAQTKMDLARNEVKQEMVTEEVKKSRLLR